MCPSRDFSWFEDARRRAPSSTDAAVAFFRLADDVDARALEALLASTPGVEVHDTYLQQLGELIETRQPARAFRGSELDREVEAHLASRATDNLGTWVYYPWSRRLVHVLDESDFIELRTSRNRYKITADEQALLATKRVGVVGLSVGRSVAIALATERAAGELRLADFDRLSLSNLNRITAAVHEIGALKVDITAREIAELDPYLRVTRFAEGLTAQNLDRFFLENGRLDLIIDECDDLEMKVLLRTRARELRVAVLMDTSDRGLLDVERFDLEPTRPLFHGMLGDIDPERLRGLSTEDKIPFIADILGRETLSSRMVASMVEIGQTIRTWPQLASAVALGGALGGDTARRVLLGHMTCSGRFSIDLERLISSEEGIHHTALSPTSVEDNVAIELDVVGSRDGRAAPNAVLERIVETACMAPSGGNVQPWRWLVDGSDLWLFHDRERSASFLDFEDTAAMAALGASLENAVLAAHAAGLEVEVESFPAGAPRELAVARMRFGRSSTESHSFDHLAGALGERHSNRRLGARRALAEADAAALTEAAAATPGVRLELLRDEASLDEIGAILGAGDRVRFLNSTLHAEMMREIRWTPEEVLATRDGIDLETLELSPADRVGIQLCRSWPAMQLVQKLGGGASLEKGSRRAVAASAAVGLVLVEDTTASAFLAGGRAMQRVWLTATARGLAVQPMSSLPYLFARLVRGGGDGMPPNQQKQLHALRSRYERLFRVTPTTGEVLLFRFAHAEPASVRALRRPLSDVFESR